MTANRERFVQGREYATRGYKQERNEEGKKNKDSYKENEGGGEGGGNYGAEMKSRREKRTTGETAEGRGDNKGSPTRKGECNVDEKEETGDKLQSPSIIAMSAFQRSHHHLIADDDVVSMMTIKLTRSTFTEHAVVA